MKKQGRAMPQWRPSPEALVRRFAAAMRAVPGAEVRQMFGYPAAFLHGHMFAGLFQEHMLLRLSPEDRAALSQRPGAKPFEPMPGRPMREYLVVPPAMLDAPKQREPSLARAFGYAASLPPQDRRNAARTRKA